MQYTININQYAAVCSGLDLDIIDLAIFDFIQKFVNSRKCTKVTTPDGQKFFMIKHAKIIQEMPILGIKTPRGIRKRIDNLTSAKLLRRVENCQGFKYPLYQFGENYDVMFFDPGSMNEHSTDTNESASSGNESATSGNERSEQSEQPFRVSRNECSELHLFNINHNTNNHNTKINNNIASNDALSKTSFDASPVGEVVELWNEKIRSSGSTLKPVKQITEQRKSAISARLRECHGDASVIDEMIDKATRSDFLNGKNDRGFIASFDWCFKPNNFVKIIEGNYDNRQRFAANGQNGDNTAEAIAAIKIIRSGRTGDTEIWK